MRLAFVVLWHRCRGRSVGIGCVAENSTPHLQEDAALAKAKNPRTGLSRDAVIEQATDFAAAANVSFGGLRRTMLNCRRMAGMGRE